MTGERPTPFDIEHRTIQEARDAQQRNQQHSGGVMPLLPVLAAIAAGAGVILNGVGAHTNAWFSPIGLLLLATALLALHFAGIGPRKP